MNSMTKNLVMSWTKLRSTLSSDPRFSGRLAGVFKGHVPTGFKKHTRRILYVGKATAGTFHEADASASAFFCNKAGFWTFARRLSEHADCECSDRSNLAWSNLCKIGRSRGNPNAALAEVQRPLAIETLRVEIKRLEPTLVVFVTGDYQDQFVYQALGISKGSPGDFETRTHGKRELYYRRPVRGWPALLWLAHPQGKDRETIQFWERMASDLLELDG